MRHRTAHSTGEDDPLDHDLEREAARALRQIARSEAIKAHIRMDRPLHDASVGTALRFIAGETLDSRARVASSGC